MPNAVAELRRAVEVVDRKADAAISEIGGHEKVCAERMLRIDGTMDVMAGDIAEVKGAVTTLAADVKKIGDSITTAASKHEARRWAVNWKAWTAVGAVALAVLTLIGWMAAELYALEPLRIQQATAHYQSSTKP